MQPRISLRPMRLEDVPFNVRLRNEHDTRKWFFSTAEITIESCEEWFLSRNPETSLDHIAELDHEPVGYITVGKIDWVKKSGEFGPWMVLPRFRGTGIAEQMGRQIICIARELGLTLLYSEGRLDNPRSMRACEKVGFIVEPIVAEDRFRVRLEL